MWVLLERLWRVVMSCSRELIDQWSHLESISVLTCEGMIGYGSCVVGGMKAYSSVPSVAAALVEQLRANLSS